MSDEPLSAEVAATMVYRVSLQDIFFNLVLSRINPRSAADRVVHLAATNDSYGVMNHLWLYIRWLSYYHPEAHNALVELLLDLERRPGTISGEAVPAEGANPSLQRDAWTQLPNFDAEMLMNWNGESVAPPTWELWKNTNRFTAKLAISQNSHMGVYSVCGLWLLRIALEGWYPGMRDQLPRTDRLRLRIDHLNFHVPAAAE